MARCSNSAIKMFATIGDTGDPIASPSVILVVSNSLPEEDRGDLVETSLKKTIVLVKCENGFQWYCPARTRIIIIIIIIIILVFTGKLNYVMLLASVVCEEKLLVIQIFSFKRWTTTKWHGRKRCFCLCWRFLWLFVHLAAAHKWCPWLSKEVWSWLCFVC